MTLLFIVIVLQQARLINYRYIGDNKNDFSNKNSSFFLNSPDNVIEKKSFARKCNLPKVLFWRVGLLLVWTRAYRRSSYSWKEAHSLKPSSVKKKGKNV